MRITSSDLRREGTMEARLRCEPTYWLEEDWRGRSTSWIESDPTRRARSYTREIAASKTIIRWVPQVLRKEETVKTALLSPRVTQNCRLSNSLPSGGRWRWVSLSAIWSSEKKYKQWEWTLYSNGREPQRSWKWSRLGLTTGGFRRKIP